MKAIHDLQTILTPDRVKSRLIDRYSYARDAGFYRLIPQIVVQPKDETEIQSLFAYCRQNHIPLVFRAAGTSLSGQSITDSILVEINRNWKDYSISEDRSVITLDPGVVGAQANTYLKPYKRKIGPDPASLNSCFIGGIVSNNASGMSSGVRYNSANTLHSMRVLLPNGVAIDSADPHADNLLKEKTPEIYSGLIEIRDHIRSTPKLRDRIAEKYGRKNTTGYALNAFIDHERPADILVHLMIGSEGTLGFISKIRLYTFEDKPHKSAALLIFQNIEDAANAVYKLKETGAEALEIMDRAALRSVAAEPGMPAELNDLPDTAAALLCEYQDSQLDTLHQKVQDGRSVLQNLNLVHPADFTEDEKTRLLYWSVRKGLLPAAGAMRKKGTTVIIEDLGFRLEDLAPAILDLQALFQKHGYEDAVIFGHTEAGNIHFIISQSFDTQKGIDQYRAFMDDVIDMTVNKYDGALKTEHGTGRNMAPFVETEWGSDAYQMMKKIKALLDPDNILNPGVIINDDPECHLNNIKPTPPAQETVDKCIECGFCEVWCPSRDLTMTPRRRIATLREITMLQNGSAADRKTAKQLRKAYRYDGVDSCAADGLCAMGCPVNIDTGDLVRYFRELGHSPWSNRIALWTVDHFKTVVRALRIGLGVASVGTRVMGNERLTRFTLWLHRHTNHHIPAWNVYMPGGARKLPILHSDDTSSSIVYFPSCLSRGMGRIKDERFELSVPETIARLCSMAGISVRYPDNVNELCCGTPYSSKGYYSAFIAMATRVTLSLYETTRGGDIPVVMDTSPCTYKMKHYGDHLQGDILEKWKALTILDVVEFMHDQVMPNLDLKPLKGTAVLHPTCSTLKMEQDEKMLAIGNACAEHATIPDHHGCCGFAGDRGFLLPDLTASATRPEAEDVKTLSAGAGHYSVSRTCEIGMSSSTGKPYSSIVHLLYQASPKTKGHKTK
jgi:D-lactate dehydrogenase